MKARQWLAAVLTVSMGFPLLAAEARQASAPPVAAGYTLPSTHSWDIATNSDEVYRILVSYPSGEAPAGGWPVLYVLDGNAFFASFAETRRLQEHFDIGKSIIVGVGYPTDQAYDSRRLYDFTSAAPPPEPWRSEFAKLRSGGREKFLDFLTGPLRREIGKRYQTNPDRQALFGHSLGGLFAVHTLFSRPEAFHAIIAASPTLFWHEQEMLEQERDFAARLRKGEITKVSRLLIVMGELEETILERWDGEALAARMQQLSQFGLRTRSQIYAGEGHMTVPVRAVPDTLRFAFSWP
jgi:predicted alpha/beta superfamily hydrolase